MAREYVPIFFDWLEVTQDLTPEEKGNLIDAVVAYASGNEYEHLLTGGVRIAFRFLKGQVDRNNRISEARSEAGRNKPEQNETNVNKTEQTASKSPKEKEKEKENKKERMTPPTREEVAAFCSDNGLTIDVDRFMNYYESNGWKVGRNPMKNWQATVRNWTKEKAPPGKIVSAQAYSQRDYADVQKELMEEQAREMEQFMLRGAG